MPNIIRCICCATHHNHSLCCWMAWLRQRAPGQAPQSPFCSTFCVLSELLFTDEHQGRGRCVYRRPHLSGRRLTSHSAGLTRMLWCTSQPEKCVYFYVCASERCRRFQSRLTWWAWINARVVSHLFPPLDSRNRRGDIIPSEWIP